MNEAIVAAWITGTLSLVGVVLSNLLSARKNEQAIRTAQAVTDTKLEALTAEVRRHNRFAQRMPVVEEQIKAMDRRIGNLEQQDISAAHFSS